MADAVPTTKLAIATTEAHGDATLCCAF